MVLATFAKSAMMTSSPYTENELSFQYLFMFGRDFLKPTTPNWISEFSPSAINPSTKIYIFDFSNILGRVKKDNAHYN
jgi:hypothetical protein